MIWWTIFAMAGITFYNRYAFFARALAYQPSAGLKQFLGYSSAAVLTSIWAPIVFQVDSSFTFSHAGWDYLIAATLAALLSFARVLSIVTVMLSAATFFGLRFFVF
ncbi:MAG: branched-subunit amino acid transport protein [Cryomorphaceae bacterium]|jgi:branched-subunit amino acid transport protein